MVTLRGAELQQNGKKSCSWYWYVLVKTSTIDGRIDAISVHDNKLCPEWLLIQC